MVQFGHGWRLIVPVASPNGHGRDCRRAVRGRAYCIRSDAASSRNLGGLIETPEFEAAYDFPIPLTGYAMAASRHMHQFGTTRAHLAEVAVAARRWAQLNPEATERGPLTVEEVLRAPLVADPFTRYDCCLVSDGGAAIVVTSSARRIPSKVKRPTFSAAQALTGIGRSPRCPS